MKKLYFETDVEFTRFIKLCDQFSIKYELPETHGKLQLVEIEDNLTNYKFNCKDKTITASLDRIDSNIGYIKGNIQWVSQCINYMKNTMTHEETIKICKLITDFWNKNPL